MLQGMFDASAPYGMHSYWKSEYLNDLDDGAVDALIAGGQGFASPASMVHIHHLEGAVSRAPSDATAFGRRDARFVTNVIGGWFEPALQDEEIATVRETAQAVRRYSGGGAYLNFFDADEGDARIRAAYGDEKYDRLVALKDRYDPDNVFRLNQNISPSRRP
jgi:FAD/FMN-containing dehydrogenase